MYDDFCDANRHLFNRKFCDSFPFYPYITFHLKSVKRKFFWHQRNFGAVRKIFIKGHWIKLKYNIKLTKSHDKWLPRLVCHGFPGCIETSVVNRIIAVEGHCHVVTRTDDGFWFGGAAMFLLNRAEGDLNVVIVTVIVCLQIKTIEGELDLLSCGDLQVPGLIHVDRIIFGKVWRLDLIW